MKNDKLKKITKNDVICIFKSLRSFTYPTVVRVMRPHQKESRKDQEPAGLSFSAK